MAAVNTTTTAPTAQDMQAQADANFARQVELNMVAESISSTSNALKTVHEAMMAVISNFK